jgi:hypothetical protein
MLDMVTDRRELKDVVVRLLKFGCGRVCRPVVESTPES